MQNVSLLAGCDMRVSGFAQVKAQLWFGGSPAQGQARPVIRASSHKHGAASPCS